MRELLIAATTHSLYHTHGCMHAIETDESVVCVEVREVGELGSLELLQSDFR